MKLQQELDKIFVPHATNFRVTCMCLCIGFICWMIPPVYLLYSGVIVYRAYEADGKSRFFRATGPFLAEHNEHRWASSEQIPNSCKIALVAAEDMRFSEHWGIDPKGIEEAVKKNQQRGKIRSGASTITQQLVKNVFLSRDRSYVRKIREALGALVLDRIMDKNDQIIWYLNIVEFGPYIYGIKAAAKRYFHKNTRRLSLGECVALIANLPSPRRRSLLLEKRQISPFLHKQYGSILFRLRTMGELPSSEIEQAKIFLDSL